MGRAAVEKMAGCRPETEPPPNVSAPETAGMRVPPRLLAVGSRPTRLDVRARTAAEGLFICRDRPAASYRKKKHR